MKKVLLAATFLLGMATVANAKADARFGLKGGLNLTHGSTTYGNPYFFGSNNYFGPGFYAGGLMELSFPKGSKFKIQPEVLFNYHSLLSHNQNVRLGNISVPLTFKYFIVPKFSVMAGPSFNFNIIGSYKNNTNSNDVLRYGDHLNTFQLGLFAGANYYIVKGFFVDIRYNYALGDVVDYNMPTSDFKYGTISLGVGYKFK